MKTPLHILLLEDSRFDAELIATELKKLGPVRLDMIQSETELRHALDSQPPDLILSDHGLPSFNGFKALEIVREETEKAAAKGRKGGGATFLECVTYRWDGHFGGDPGTGYRSKEEIEAWKQKCPIKRLADKLTRGGDLTQQELTRITENVYGELDEIAKRAEAAPLPQKKVDLNSVFAATEVIHG